MLISTNSAAGKSEPGQNLRYHVELIDEENPWEDEGYEVEAETAKKARRTAKTELDSQGFAGQYRMGNVYRIRPFKPVRLPRV